MKTVFGEAHFSVPRQKCPDCQQTFSVSTPLLEATDPLDDSNITQSLRKIAILCGSSWPFRQAANVLHELTGVTLSFGHIRWLCADEAKVTCAEFDEKYDQIEWEALVETMEVLVEYLADEPNEQAMDLMSRSVELNPGTQRIWETVDWLKNHGLSAKDARNWGRQLRDDLWRGKTVLALQSCVGLGKQIGLSPPVNKSQTELGETSLQSLYLYLRNNFDSIVDYHTHRRNGYFISSVFVEKTIDLLICRRLKLRGQNWSRQGADNIVTFRQMVKNDDWDAYWQGQKAA